MVYLKAVFLKVQMSEHCGGTQAVDRPEEELSSLYPETAWHLLLRLLGTCPSSCFWHALSSIAV